MSALCLDPDGQRHVTTRCPHCFTSLSPRTYAFRCANSGCKDVPDHALAAHRGHDVAARTVSTINEQTSPVPAGVCYVCSAESSHAVCPDCHEDLPEGWRDCITTCVAMAGARASGKSIYIAVLVKQVELWCERQNKSFLPIGRTQELYKRVYEQPLYAKRGLIDPTPSAQLRLAPQREPLMFSMGRFGERQHVLVIRDVAGEDLEDPGTAVEPFRFFREADLVTFLFDPEGVPAVRDALAGLLVNRDQKAADPVVVLRHLMRLMGSRSMLGDALAPALAVVVAKFDTLQELATVEDGPLSEEMSNLGARFNLDPSLEPTFSFADSDGLQAEVGSLLKKVHAQPLLNLINESFGKHQLFAVSALGHLTEDAARVSARGIAPFRVLDPLKWVLALQGIVPTVKHDDEAGSPRATASP
jgi:hypothetical protein